MQRHQSADRNFEKIVRRDREGSSNPFKESRKERQQERCEARKGKQFIRGG